MNMLGIIIAIISGALMSIQGVFNTSLNKQTNLWFANMYIQISAFIVCLIMYLVTNSKGNIRMLLDVKNKYILLGGVIGAFITVTVVKSISELGTAKAIMIIIISQMVVAYLIELFGLFGSKSARFEMKNLLAIVIIIVGIVIFKS